MLGTTLAALARTALVGLPWWQNVPTEVTGRDVLAVSHMLQYLEFEIKPAHYDAQVKTIASVQKAVSRRLAALRDDLRLDDPAVWTI
jgi:hypothetical protein